MVVYIRCEGRPIVVATNYLSSTGAMGTRLRKMVTNGITEERSNTTGWADPAVSGTILNANGPRNHWMKRLNHWYHQELGK